MGRLLPDLSSVDLGDAEVGELLPDGEKAVLARGVSAGRAVVIKVLRSHA
jgi:hypothetical protein